MHQNPSVELHTYEKSVGPSARQIYRPDRGIWNVRCTNLNNRIPIYWGVSPNVTVETGDLIPPDQTVLIGTFPEPVAYPTFIFLVAPTYTRALITECRDAQWFNFSTHHFTNGTPNNNVE